MAEDELVPSGGEYSSNGSSPQPLPPQLDGDHREARLYPSRPRNSLGTDGESEDSRGEEDYEQLRDSPPPLVSIKNEVEREDDGITIEYHKKNLSKIFSTRHDENCDSYEVPLDFSLKKMKHSSPLPAASRAQLDQILASRIREQRENDRARERDTGHRREEINSEYVTRPTAFSDTAANEGDMSPGHHAAPHLTAPSESREGLLAALSAGLTPGSPLHSMLQAGILPPGLLNQLPLLQTAAENRHTGRADVPSPEKLSRMNPASPEKQPGPPPLMNGSGGLLVPGNMGVFPGAGLGQLSPMPGLDMISAQNALAANPEDLFSQYRQYMLQLVQQSRKAQGPPVRNVGRPKQRKYSCGGSASGSPPMPATSLPAAMHAPPSATSMSHHGELSHSSRSLISPHHGASAAAPIDHHEPGIQGECSPVSNGAQVSPTSPVTASSLMSSSIGRKRPRPTPDERKDAAYWERRRKNNEAAKRSRDARRAKEDEIAIRAAFLEQENLKLRMEVAALKSETSKLRCMIYNS